MIEARLRGFGGAREWLGGPWELGKVSLRGCELSCVLSEPVQFGGVSTASRVGQAWVRIPVSLTPALEPCSLLISGGICPNEDEVTWCRVRGDWHVAVVRQMSPCSKQNSPVQGSPGKPVPGSRSLSAHVRQPGGKMIDCRPASFRAPGPARPRAHWVGHSGVLGALTPLPGPLLVLLAQLPPRCPLFCALGDWDLHMVDAA